MMIADIEIPAKLVVEKPAREQVNEIRLFNEEDETDKVTASMQIGTLN